MKKKKRFWSLLTVTALVVTSLNPSYALAANASKQEAAKAIVTKTDGTKKLDELAQKIKEMEGTSNEINQLYKSNDVVEIIVELKDTSLLQLYKNDKTLSESTDFDEFVTTSQAVDTSNQLIKSQDIVVQKIENIDKATSVTKIYNYTAVMNGFSIKANYSLLTKIKSLDEVKSAFVAPVYESIKTEPAMDKSVPFIGADKTWKDAGYKGEGMVVGIVDTGLDTLHEAFSYLPSTPRVHKEDVSNILQSTELSSEVLNSSVTADDVYVSDKVPYAYDYADNDAKVSGGGSHGTHVAGTVAASGSAIVDESGAIEIEKGILGVAPEAQLMIFKVFGDVDEGASTTDILASLDDAVKLGVDVINMSLGSGSGFTDEGIDTINEAYDRVKDAGINLDCSAGNNSSLSSSNNYGGYSLPSNPDTSVVGSPSTYEASLSVASLKNSGTCKEQMLANGRNIIYTDNAVDGKNLTDVLTKGNHEYVDAGLGTEDDYAKIDVKGKIALVQRGSISFSDKEVNAFKAGAIAVIVYNNTSGTISMLVNSYDIPAVSITMEDGHFLLGLEKKEILIDSNLAIDESGYASDFSSWGVTPDLKLKPEIAAPGEGIYSSIPGGYEIMSGTSMASPHIAGATALVKEYVNQQFGNLSKVEKEDLVNQLLMSTANPMVNKDTLLPFSPRKQGAGMVNVYNAVTTGTYLYVEGQSRTKIELGDDVNKTGQYVLKFNVKNVNSMPMEYRINTTTLTEKVLNGYLAEDGYQLNPVVTYESVGEKITDNNLLLVGPNDDITVTATVTLSSEDKAYLDSNFINGEFVEGYISLTPTEGAKLSIPYMGFYGDWTKAPIMDSVSLYEGDGYQQTSSEAYNFILGKYQYILGQNLYATLNKVALPLDKNKIAISPDGDYYFDSVDAVTTSLLRNVKNLNYQILDDKANVLYNVDSSYERKSFYLSSQGFMNYALNVEAWDGKDKDGKALPNNATYTYRVTGSLDYDGHEQDNAKDSWEFPVTIDIEKPVIKDTTLYEKDNRKYIDVNVSDNQYVSAISLYTADGIDIASQYLNESTKATTSKVTFDVTDSLSNGYILAVTDYAINEQDYVVNYDLNISLDKSKLDLKVGAKDTIKVIGEDEAKIVLPSVSWTSSNDTIATVKDGVVIAKKAGVATITATTLYNKTATCKVTVTKQPETPTQPTQPSQPTQPTTTPTPTASPTTSPTTTPTATPQTQSPTSESILKKVKINSLTKKKFYVGNTKNIIVTLPEEAANRKVSITYKSSDKKIVTVSKTGLLTAIKAGTAKVTITVKIDGVSKKYTNEIKVYAPYISITKKAKQVKVGDDFTFKAKAYGVKGNIIWSISDSKIAKIDTKTGTLKAIKEGTVTITAKIGNVKKIFVVKIIK